MAVIPSNIPAFLKNIWSDFSGYPLTIYDEVVKKTL